MPISDANVGLKNGHIHPLSRMMAEMNYIFYEMGFEFVYGPEIETERYNFDAINVPREHPARDMQDSLWILGCNEIIARTQLSGIQVRHMEKHNPPLRIVYSGKVYRSEATDAVHEAQFYQFEGLLVDRHASLAEMKGMFEFFFSQFFGKNTNVRLRPAYFPFVEPGVEIDMSCFKCSGDGCAICKKTGWIEIVGAGMVHPNVIKNAGHNPNDWSGFAFCFGMDRLAMMKYGVDDVRLFYSGDLRFVNQF